MSFREETDPGTGHGQASWCSVSSFRNCIHSLEWTPAGVWKLYCGHSNSQDWSFLVQKKTMYWGLKSCLRVFKSLKCHLGDEIAVLVNWANTNWMYLQSIFYKYWLATYLGPGTALDTGERASVLMKLTLSGLWGRQPVSKQTKNDFWQ